MIFENLDGTFRDFIKNSGSEVIIFCPYIQSSSLKRILSDLHSKLTIVTSWKTIDILRGVSDLDVYPLCKSIGAYLYINQRIHLKVICDSYHNAIIGSANITDKGLGVATDFNLECAVLYETLNRQQQVYLRSIIKESALIKDQEFNKITSLVNEYKQEFKEQNDIENIDFSTGINKEFLISALPMSISIDTFFDYYSGKLDSQGFTDVDYNCAIHDLALYQIPENLSKSDFLKYLNKAFFSQPFIQELRKFIHKDRYFGEIKQWVQSTCLDVPVPSRRDLTGNVQVLYRWFKELGKDEFIVDQPSHSERIRPRI